MMTNTDLKLFDKAREIARLERRALELEVNLADKQNFDELRKVITDFIVAKDEISRRLIDSAHITAEDPAVRSLLRKIRAGDPLYLDMLVAWIEGEVGEPLTLASRLSPENFSEEMFYQDIEELMDKTILTRISHYDIFRGLVEASTLIMGRTVPSELAPYVEEAKWCLAFQQYLAASILCRTILETAARDICNKKSYFRTGKNVRDISEVKFTEIIRRAAAPLSASDRDSTNRLYRKLSRVVHNRGPREPNYVGHFSQTVLLVEKLYDANGLDVVR